jgi:hypothetical protein
MPRPTNYVSINEEKSCRVANERRHETLDDGEIKCDGDCTDHGPPQTAAPYWFGFTFAPAIVLCTHATGVAATAIAALRPQFLDFWIGDDMLSYDRDAGQNHKHCCHSNSDVDWNPNDSVNVHARKQRADIISK